jgi:short-subunit dehydrogenase
MKKAIIIGATSGIGKELALLYAKAGYQVGITGRRTELLLQLQQQFPHQLFTETFDVTGTNNIQHLESLINQMGGMDIFIYNSGTADISKNLDWALDKVITQTNVNGFIELTNYAFNYFMKQGYGQIAGISSIASIRGNSWAPAYGASKAFMSNYMEGLSIKTQKMKAEITVTDIQPGFVKTAMAKGDGLFWVAPVEKAADQIFSAITRRKRRVYITKRWAIIAWIMKRVPFFLYKKLG